MNRKQVIDELNKQISDRDEMIRGYRSENQTLNQQIARLKRDLAEARIRQAAAAEQSFNKKGSW